MITHTPYQATITFIRSGEPGIIMRETFRCRQQCPVAEWLEVLADYCSDSAWLEVIEIITIQYWFTVTEEALSEAHYAGRHRG
jgi:hypothetical protein